MLSIFHMENLSNSGLKGACFGLGLWSSFGIFNEFELIGVE